MKQISMFGEPEAEVAPAAPAATPAPAPRKRAAKSAPPPPAPPVGPERTSDADEFEARLVRAITLRPYQREAARWLSERRSAILADEPGVGKTPSIVAALAPGAPVIVICQAVGREGVWPRHVAWRPDLKPWIVRSKKDFAFPRPREVLIVNYDLLPDWLEVLQASAVPERLHVVLDEAQLVKHPTTRRTKRAAALCAAARERGGTTWLVTGTPLDNAPLDLWNLLGVAGLQDATWRTLRRFCRAFGRNPETWEWTSPVECGVPEVLRRVMLRREFREVVKDMPPQQWEEVQVEISAEAAAAASKVVEALKVSGIDLETATAEILQSIGKNKAAGEMITARKLLAAAKLPALMELLDAHEQESESPVLVFSAHRAPIDALALRPGWARLSGDESPAERAQRETDFQAGKLKGLALTIRAGGTMVTLTRGRRAIFVDREWSPGWNAQAEGRIFRADDFTRGSSDPVIYTDLVADHPVDRRLAKLLAGKRDVIAASVSAASVGVGDAPIGGPALMIDKSPAFVGGLVHSSPERVTNEARGDTPAQATRGTQQDAPPGVAREQAAPGKRHARMPVEFWAEDAVVLLARASGVSAFDVPLLRALVLDLERGLDDARWLALVKVCRRYAAIVGSPPI